MMKTYECNIGLGWGVRGPAISGIRAKVHELGLKMEPLPWAKMNEIVQVYNVKVEGEDEAVDKFEQYMREQGHDDRAKQG